MWLNVYGSVVAVRCDCVLVSNKGITAAGIDGVTVTVVVGVSVGVGVGVGDGHTCAGCSTPLIISIYVPSVPP